MKKVVNQSSIVQHFHKTSFERIFCEISVEYAAAFEKQFQLLNDANLTVKFCGLRRKTYLDMSLFKSIM